MDAINSSKPVQNKPNLSLSAGAASPSNTPAPAQVASNFSEITSNNKKSVDTLMSNRQEVENALAELRKLADNSGRSLGFSKDPAVSGPVITVTDNNTGKVVRQIPVEVVVRVAHSIEKMKGLLFDKVL
ncbi:MAG: flagellar protein FlaG [Betaproteobacteria bacterium]|nr:flagellar protein FlaG [Betaproteobacteria bacterium]